jgi:hypothetical protein
MSSIVIPIGMIFAGLAVIGIGVFLSSAIVCIGGVLLVFGGDIYERIDSRREAKAKAKENI